MPHGMGNAVFGVVAWVPCAPPLALLSELSGSAVVTQSSIAECGWSCGPGIPGVASTRANTGTSRASQCTASLKRSASRLYIMSRI